MGTVDRSCGGSLNNATHGVTGSYHEFIGATILLAVGDETGISLVASYTF